MISLIKSSAIVIFFKETAPLFRGVVFVSGSLLDKGQLFDYRSDVVSEDSLVALVSHCSELNQEGDYLDNSQFEFSIVHFENLFSETC